MPKNHKKMGSSSSCNRARVSPYDCNSNNTRRNRKNNLGSSSSTRSNTSTSEKKDQWEKAICPICKEHPHNAVLLICSSHEKGCRPYMCDTSYRHSNCFDQFCKLHGLTPSKSTTSIDDQPNGFSPRENRQQLLELACPLCRGNISGWIVVQGARMYLNSRIRGCALESCDFSGNYGELRKHARLQHPSARPISVSDNNNNSGNTSNIDDDLTAYINNATELVSLLDILNRLIRQINTGRINNIINQSRLSLSEDGMASH